MSSIEIYVIAALVAAIALILASRPASHTAATQHLLEGVLCQIDTEVAPTEQSLHFECTDNGIVLLRRHGLRELTQNAAVSLAIEVKGFDIEIKERVVPQRPGDNSLPIDTALFTLDFLAPERYFVRYTSEFYSVMAAFSLSVRQEMWKTVQLS